jgi:hypothetical protein
MPGIKPRKRQAPKRSAESNVVAEWLPTRLQNFLSSFLPNYTKSHEYKKQGAPQEFFHVRKGVGEVTLRQNILSPKSVFPKILDSERGVAQQLPPLDGRMQKKNETAAQELQ